MRYSAGLLVFRPGAAGPEVLIGHMGGPFWARKDAAAWSIPKGEYTADESPLEAAVREFTEELGAPPPVSPDIELGAVRQSSAKTVTVFARASGDWNFDPTRLTSNLVEIQWPPRSGRTLLVPELDRVQWCELPVARERLVKGQVAFLDRLVAVLGV